MLKVKQLLKNFIIYFSYLIIERFPVKYMIRLKTAGLVLLTDWNEYVKNIPYDANAKNFLNCSVEDINRCFEKLDFSSQEIARKYLKHCYFNEMIEISKNFGNLYIIDWDKRLSLKQIRERERINRRMEVLSLHYHVNAGRETFICHHGLVYAPEKVKDYLRGKDFIDAGAYKGESTLIFLQYGPKCIYAFEPEPKNCECFRKTLEANGVTPDRYALIEAGLNDKPGTICSDGLVNNLLERKKDEIPFLSLDSFDSQHKLKTGLIKSDVEGMGLILLRGAENVIRRDRPVLALCIYHNPDEFFGQYQLLESWGLDYCFRIVDLPPDSDCEITLFGYPKNLA